MSTKSRQKQSVRRLEKLILEGLKSEAVQVTPEFWTELKAEAAARLAAKLKNIDIASA